MSKFGDYINEQMSMEDDMLDKFFSTLDPDYKAVAFRMLKVFILSGLGQTILELKVLTPSSLEHKLYVAVAIALLAAVEKFAKKKLNYTEPLKAFAFGGRK